MSVSKWAWTEEKCEGDFCPGDCDMCPKAEEPDEDPIMKKIRKMMLKRFYTAEDLKNKMAEALKKLEQKQDEDAIYIPVIFNKYELLDMVDILCRVEAIRCPHCFKSLFDSRKYHAMLYCDHCGASLFTVRNEEGHEK